MEVRSYERCAEGGMKLHNAARGERSGHYFYQPEFLHYHYGNGEAREQPLSVGLPMPEFVCNTCWAVFDSLFDLHMHMTDRHESGAFDSRRRTA